MTTVKAAKKKIMKFGAKATQAAKDEFKDVSNQWTNWREVHRQDSP
jgi:hypothetical protein